MTFYPLVCEVSWKNSCIILIPSSVSVLSHTYQVKWGFRDWTYFKPKTKVAVYTLKIRYMNCNRIHWLASVVNKSLFHWTTSRSQYSCCWTLQSSGSVWLLLHSVNSMRVTWNRSFQKSLSSPFYRILAHFQLSNTLECASVFPDRRDKYAHWQSLYLQMPVDNGKIENYRFLWAATWTTLQRIVSSYLVASVAQLKYSCMLNWFRQFPRCDRRNLLMENDESCLQYHSSW